MVKPEIRPVSGFRDEPRVIVLGHDQTVADRISRRDPSRDVPWQPQRSVCETSVTTSGCSKDWSRRSGGSVGTC